MSEPDSECECGATATEYALLMAFIAVILIAGTTLYGEAMRDYFLALAVDLPASFP